MYEIKCPNCGEVFQVEKAAYAEIVEQVRNDQFSAEVEKRVEALKQLMETKQETKLLETERKYQQKIDKKDQEISRLQQQAENADIQKKLAVTEAVREKDSEINGLKLEMAEEKTKAENQVRDLQDKFDKELAVRDDEIVRLKEFKMRQSTKMIGENLEQHCLTVFNRIRMDAFPNAYFEKDNEVVDGTKGDFIFRENTDDGIEIISIMFEMKNEADATATKNKNEQFLKKLDEDRNKKHCEYAVLVSTLEPDSEYYNDGIVASYKYDKMFIIRPQFFLPLISLLRKAALSNIETRRELMMIRRDNLDLQKFDAELNDFQVKFGKNVSYAQNHFRKTIDEINDAIKHLENVRDELEATDKQLRLANDKAQELSIKKLTKGNFGMQQKFLDAGIEIR